MGTARAIQYLRSSLSLPVPWIPLPSLYQAEVMDASQSRAWQRTEKNSSENKEKRLSNYFKQRTKLKHCAEPSKGSASGALRFFPAVWAEGNAKGICAELTVKGERERGRERKHKKKNTLEYRLPNELKGLASFGWVQCEDPSLILHRNHSP